MNKLKVNLGPGGDTVSSFCQRIAEVLKDPEHDENDIKDIIDALETVALIRRR